MDFKQFFEQGAFANTSPSSGPTHGMPQQQQQNTQQTNQQQTRQPYPQNQLQNSFGKFVRPNDIPKFNTQFANVYKLRDPDQNKEYYNLATATGEQLRKNQGIDAEVSFYNNMIQNLKKSSPYSIENDPQYFRYMTYARTRDINDLYGTTNQNQDNNQQTYDDGEKFDVPGVINKLSRANYDLGGVTSKAMQSGF